MPCSWMYFKLALFFLVVLARDEMTGNGRVQFDEEVLAAIGGHGENRRNRHD